MHAVTSSPSSPPKTPLELRRRRGGRRDNTLLGLLWVHGEMHAAVFRRDVQLRSWRSAPGVTTLAGFEQALDEALNVLDFNGADVALILAHDQFQHRAEQAPAFSEAATRSFLKGLVGRMEQEQGPILWVSQRAHSTRNEGSVLLHLLSGAFYDQLNGIMLARRLELTRILPLVVPLQLAIDSISEARDQPILMAAPAGSATVIMAGQAGNPLLFARCILARWDDDPERIGVEINRSLLYAKQQFGTTLSRVRLLGEFSDSVALEVRAKCPAATEVACHPSGPEQWLRTVAQASARNSVNLVAGYLRHKQRQRLFRRSIIALASLGVALSGLDAVQVAQRWSQEKVRLAALRASESTLRAERARLVARNEVASRRARFIAQVEGAAVAPVPVRFAAFLANTLPPNFRLTHVSVRSRDEGSGWALRLEGVVEADEESGKEAIAGLERQLTRSAFRVRIPDTGRGIAGLHQPGAGVEAWRFVLEGGLLEN